MSWLPLSLHRMLLYCVSGRRRRCHRRTWDVYAAAVRGREIHVELISDECERDNFTRPSAAVYCLLRRPIVTFPLLDPLLVGLNGICAKTIEVILRISSG